MLWTPYFNNSKTCDCCRFNQKTEIYFNWSTHLTHQMMESFNAVCDKNISIDHNLHFWDAFSGWIFPSNAFHSEMNNIFFFSNQIVIRNFDSNTYYNVFSTIKHSHEWAKKKKIIIRPTCCQRKCVHSNCFTTDCTPHIHFINNAVAVCRNFFPRTTFLHFIIIFSLAFFFYFGALLISNWKIESCAKCNW